MADTAYGMTINTPIYTNGIVKGHALCCSINDYHDSPLQGCHNDSLAWSGWLQRHGASTIRLVDAQVNRIAILERLKEMLSQAKHGDQVWFTYSGHGSRIKDVSGDEEDGLDETLYLLDGNLLDDEIYDAISNRKEGVEVICVFDCCHSGTATRNMKNNNNMFENWTSRPRYTPSKHFHRKALRRHVVKKKMKNSMVGSCSDILFASCLPNEYSYDAIINGKPIGAFTNYAMESLDAIGKDATWKDWQLETKKHLPSPAYPQTPQLYIGGQNA